MAEAAVIGVAAPPPRLARGVVGLLALAVFINYVDRGNFATAAPFMKDALRLSNAQIGVLISAFFWIYAPAQLVVGLLAERISAYRVLAAGVAIWSLATVLTGFAGGFASLLGLRLLLGFGECAAFPCSSKLLARHLPPSELGAANGLIAVGLALGPAVGTLGGGLLMTAIGWRGSFLLFGALSLLWLWPWLRATRGARAASPRRSTAPARESDAIPSFAAIMRRRAAWGAALGQFCGNYTFYFVVSWLPLYLVKDKGFSGPQMAAIGGLIYLVYAIAGYGAGRLSDRWIRRGAGVSLVRKSFIVGGYIGTAACLGLCATADRATAIAMLLLVAIFFGLGTPTLYAIGQTLAGPHAAGKWIGFQNGVANLAGIVGPIVTGVVVDRTGQFGWAFVIAAAFAVAGVVCWGLIVPKVAPLDWGVPARI